MRNLMSTEESPHLVTTLVYYFKYYRARHMVGTKPLTVSTMLTHKYHKLVAFLVSELSFACIFIVSTFFTATAKTAYSTVRKIAIYIG